jgi:hypothetical protein
VVFVITFMSSQLRFFKSYIIKLGHAVT